MELERVALEVPEADRVNADILREQLAKKAKDVLGYSGLTSHLDNIGRVSHVARDIAVTFHELDIKPFSPESVDKYKAQEKKRQWRKSFRELPLHAKFFYGFTGILDILPGHLAGCLFLTGLVSLALCIPLWTIAGKNGFYFHHTGIVASWLSPLGLFGAASIICAAMDDAMGKYSIKQWSWIREGIPFTRLPIPDFALDTAIRIKEKLPYVDIFVDFLHNTDRRLGDPFLVVRVGGQDYFVEVWNEPTFEAQQRKA